MGLSRAAARTGFLRKEACINYINKEGWGDLLPTKQMWVMRYGLLKKKWGVGYVEINGDWEEHGILLVYIAIEE